MHSAITTVVALMPIHPKYSASILRGEKKVEFRKNVLRRAPELVLIYETRPRQQVVGLFIVEDIDIAAPDILWERYNATGGINKEDFQEYYLGRDRGVAFRIGRVLEFADPYSLSEFGINHSAPQSAIYIDTPSLVQVLGPCIIDMMLSWFVRATDITHSLAPHNGVSSI